MRHVPRRVSGGPSSGFSVIEALVASTVFATAMAAAAGMLTLSMKTTQASALDAHATAIAQEELENLRSLVYASIASRDTYTSASPHVFGGARYTMHTDVQADSPAANMKTITVTVSWTDHGAPRSYELRTIYTNING